MSDDDVDRVIGFFRRNASDLFTIRDVQKALKMDKMKTSGIIESLVYFGVVSKESIAGRLVYKFKSSKKS